MINQAVVIKAFDPTPRYLDNLFNIDNSNELRMVSQVYPTELQLNEAIRFDNEDLFGLDYSE